MELMENLGMQMSLDTMEISMQLHLKTKVELAYHSSLSILYIPEGVKPASTSDICIPMVMAVVFRRAKSWNHPRFPSMEKWIKKYIIEYYSPTKENIIISFM
jgi:hypothetical protein